MSNGNVELALVLEGKLVLWSNPSGFAELHSDPMYVGRPQAPLVLPPGARAGVVRDLGAGAHGFEVIEDPVQVLIVAALFDPQWKHSDKPVLLGGP